MVRKKEPASHRQFSCPPGVVFSKYNSCLRHCFQKVCEEQLDPDLALRLARRFDKLATNQFSIWYQDLDIRVLPDEDAEEETDLEHLQQYEESFAEVGKMEQRVLCG